MTYGAFHLLWIRTSQIDINYNLLQCICLWTNISNYLVHLLYSGFWTDLDSDGNVMARPSLPLCDHVSPPPPPHPKLSPFSEPSKGLTVNGPTVTARTLSVHHRRQTHERKFKVTLYCFSSERITEQVTAWYTVRGSHQWSHKYIKQMVENKHPHVDNSEISQTNTLISVD